MLEIVFIKLLRIIILYVIYFNILEYVSKHRLCFLLQDKT